MSKVSIGLRGWRFEESTVFDESGNFRPVEELPPDTRRRLVRLLTIHDDVCDACWLETEDAADSEPATVVYGEPLAEVTVCDDHEADLLYWYRECGGADYRGTDAFQERFHEWYAAENRAPADYGGVEHVMTAPDAVPTPRQPNQPVVDLTIPEDERTRIDLHDPEFLREVFGEDRAAELLAAIRSDEDDDLDLEDLDLDVDYST